MKAATIQELKEELKQTPPSKLIELCLRLSRFKKENKELLTYLLFEEQDELSYLKSVKAEISAGFEAVDKGNNLYLVKKSLRKILRFTNKYIRYTGSKTIELELLLFYCLQLKQSGIPIHKTQALTNLYDMQLKKINKLIPALHEDLRYDFTRQLDKLKADN